MKSIEISNELYDRVIEQSKHGMPFEPIVWEILKERDQYKKLCKDMMGTMVGAAFRIPQQEIERMMREIDQRMGDI